MNFLKNLIKAVVKTKTFYVVLIIIILFFIAWIQCSCIVHNQKMINKYKQGDKIEKKY